MAQNRFDQACRYGAKLDPAGFVGWLLSAEPTPQFLDWLDTRTLPFPGDPERTCDTVARLQAGGQEWAMVIEFGLTPDPTMFGRLLVYLGQLWLEGRSSGQGRYQVGAAVLNLTGQGQASRDMRLGSVRTCLEVRERNLNQDDAAQTLAGIQVGSLARCILPWVPLMQNGGDFDILKQWIDLAGAEADAKRRSDYGGLALVFAEAADRLPIWKDALKEWNMVESQQVLEWIREGEAKGEQRALLRLLEKRFPPGPPAELIAKVRASTNAAELARWFDTALDTPSLDAFRKATGI